MTLFESVMKELYLRTILFSGPQQFALNQTYNFLVDLYLTLYCPWMWMSKTKKANWDGWMRKRKGRHFHYVRKPDPQEELKRRGYFKKNKFCYILKKRVPAVTSYEKQLMKNNKNYVYVMNEPENGEDIFMVKPYDWREDDKDFDFASFMNNSMVNPFVWKRDEEESFKSNQRNISIHRLDGWGEEEETELNTFVGGKDNM